VDQKETHTCRICLDEESEEGDFFVSPCKCSGTAEFVHFNCLKYWIDKKIKLTHTKHATTIVWEKLQCEICKF